MKKATTSGRRVLVLGGGIIGVTTAYALAKRGFEVTVAEREDGVGLQTSFANGSLITPSMADPWAAVEALEMDWPRGVVLPCPS
jgi:D-amino-acid dehydrogenase